MPRLSIVAGRIMRSRLPSKAGVAVEVPAMAGAGDELLAIARAAADGDADAAATLVLRLGGGILRIARKVFGPAHPDLDDVAQEAALAVLNALPQFRGESSVAHYAYRVALHTALGARRKSRAALREAQSLALPLDEVADHTQSPHEEALSRHRRELVLGLLDELSAPIAEALAMHFMLGHSVEDIARALGLSHHTVWSRLRLGKKALRRRLRGKVRLADLLETAE